MTLLLNTSIKVTVIVLVALAATWALRRRSAAVRHFVLAAALLCAAATPALRFVAPAWQTALAARLHTSSVQFIDRPLAVFDSIDPAAGAAAFVPAGTARWAAVARALAAIWLAGTAISLLMLLAGLFRLARMAAHATPVTDGPWADTAAEMMRTFALRRAPVLLQGSAPTLLATWGFAPARVMLPADAGGWPADRIRIVLGHELAHVRRHDWVVQIAADVLRGAYWFNPLVWLACRRLRLESEQACDDAVLTMGVEGETYATELVDLARRFKSQTEVFLPAAAMARPSSLERRVRAMLNVRLNRDPITRTASIAAVALLIAVTVIVAGFGASAQTFSAVSGTLVDQFSRGLGDATVTLSNPKAQSKYEIKSDAGGRYEFVGLPPGTYVLVVQVPGFATVKREGIVLSGQPFQQNVTMRVGSLQETITVTNTPDTRPLDTGAPRKSEYKPGSCTSTAAGGNIRPPAKIRDVRPIYPAGAKGGQVTLEARIGEDGYVAQVEAAADADPALAHAASTAVSQWQFTPTLLDCQPIDVTMHVNVTFVAAR
jgi:beta-lactamase regulating signal transducer with metallopeptidase domain